MTVSVASFRADFPQEFGNRSFYPDQAIAYWLAIAAILMGTGTGAPPQVCSFQGSIGAGETPTNVLDVTEINFGSLSLLPLLLQGESIPTNAAVLEQLTGAAGSTGTYQLSFSAAIASEPMAAIQQGGSGSNASAFWGPSSAVPTSPPITIADFATEMWVAHQLVLEKQAVQAALAGGDPGTKIGVISSKSVNGVSVSFDTSAITDSTGGYYNQTIYGQRYWRLAKVKGGGPIQIGVGRPPFPFLIFNSFGFLGGSNAWGGPYPGIEQGGVGFGS